MEPNFEQLFREAGAAHHQAFLETDGADPEWPMWYASYLFPRIRHLFAEVTESEIVYHMVHWDRIHKAEAPERPWPEFYAQQLRALTEA